MQKRPPYRTITDPAQVDLDRHALIEASAGTGKTYTIENLVVRLLSEYPDLRLDEILLVTFTEKATCELKLRIRQKLEARIAREPADATRLQDVLDAFDAAAIHTIHGFCQTILKDYAFEHAVPFDTELVDDQLVFETLLADQMRREWPRRYGEELETLLMLSGFAAAPDRFLEQVTRLARSVYRPEVGDRLLPDTGGDLAALKTAVAETLRTLQDAVGSDGSLAGEFQRLNIHGATKKKLLNDIVLPLEGLAADWNADALDLMALDDWLGRIAMVKSTGRQGVDTLRIEKWNPSGPNPEACPRLPRVIDLLQGLADEMNRLRWLLAADTIRCLQADAAAHKAQEGLISYDDMLRLVHRALTAEGGDVLLGRLRQRYRFAFVDEFQDTDPMQWRIFRRIFLDAPGGAHRLVVIGDPKQAIYAFRGADVYAYLEARQRYEALAAAGQAGLYTLGTNWRSAAELVAVFNRLFGRPMWFPPPAAAGGFDIAYQPVDPPPPDRREPAAAPPREDAPALTLVDLSAADRTILAKARLATFVADEIGRLLAAGPMLTERDGSSRRLDAGDVAVLVRARTELSLLERALDRRQIAYSFYKKPGLFASEEAWHLWLVLRALLTPSDAAAVKQALLTPFFGWTARDLYAYDLLPPDHDLKKRLLEWQGWGQQRRFGRLFQALMEDSGLWFRSSPSPQWDRRQTNYLQILEHLQRAAYERNLDFRAMCAFLERLIAGKGAADDDIHQIETEERKVQIMTMHVAKGLEFPVVFVAGGLTRHAPSGPSVHHVVDGGRPVKIVDLGGRQGADQAAAEALEEDKRLLYVALTRARCKLYVPYRPAPGRQTWVGPVSRLLAPALDEAFDGPDPSVQRVVAPPVAVRPDPAPPAAQTGPAAPLPARLPALPRSLSFVQRKAALASFSSLHQFRSGSGPGGGGFDLGTAPSGAFDEPGPPDEPAAADLPGGTAVGSMLHDILEEIDFALVATPGIDPEREPVLADTIRRHLTRYNLGQHLLGRVARIVAATLTSPIPQITEGFTLGRLSAEDRLHEVEFFYPVQRTGPNVVPECAFDACQGFVRGFVDLIFRVEGRFFIADWKSNRLDEGYDRPHLEVAMDQAGYHLQYKLYTLATLRWLAQTAAGFDPQRDFGGVFYFFMRGMGGDDGRGVYHVPFHAIGPQARLEAEIETLLRESA